MDQKDWQAEKPDELLPDEDVYVGRFQTQEADEEVSPASESESAEAPAAEDTELTSEGPAAEPASEAQASAREEPEDTPPESSVAAPEPPAVPSANDAAGEMPLSSEDEAPTVEPTDSPLEEASTAQATDFTVDEAFPAQPADFPAEEITPPEISESPTPPETELSLSELEALLHPQAAEEQFIQEELVSAEPASDTDSAEIDDVTRILSEIAPDVALPQEEPAAEAPVPEEEPELPEQLTENEEPPADLAFQNAADGEEFDEMFHAEPEPPKTPKHKRPARKGRPKRKKGEGFFGIPNLVVTLVWLAITVVIGVTLGRMVWICAADVLAFGREDKPVTITIYETDTIDDITQKLYEGELIHYPGLFKLYASLAVDEGEIHPGIWDLNTRYDYHALVNMMSPSSSRDVIKVMIPEGYTSRQIFSLLEENKVCTIRDLSAYAADGELEDYWFLEGVTRGDPYCLDGFLFPDTYQFYKNESPENVLNKLLSNFNNRFDEEMQAQLVTLNEQLTALMRKGGKSEDFIAQNQFTVRDVVIVASMIEKETSSAEEGYTIASVIYNRLFNWGDTPAYLNIDASIVYALEGKTDLTQDDLKVDSPYNTYTHTGLTPGAISNPGLASLKAALAPQDTNYYYYVLDPSTGSHRFTTTYDEHQAAIASIGGQE